MRRPDHAHLVTGIAAAARLIRPAELLRARQRAGSESLARPLVDARGFMLTELITVLAILGIVVTALATVFVSSIRAEVDQNRRFQAQQGARLALDQLRREGHCASGVVPQAPTTRVTLTFGAHCRPGAVAPFTVTWCTSGSGTRWALRRVEPALADAAPCADGKRVADYLTTGNVFGFTPASPTRRATLGVAFTVSVDGTTRIYRLHDDIVLRNSPRG